MKRPRSVLGQRLVLLKVAASSVLAVLITGIQLLVEYRRDLADVDTQFTIIGRSYLPRIKETVW